MPALPFAPGVCKIVVKQTLASVNVFNVLHAYMNNLGSPLQSEMDALATAVRSAWVTNVLPLQANVLTLSDVVVTDLSSDIGSSSTVTGTSLGTAAGTAAPASAAVCWSWKIANRYRGGHPRTYIAGLTTGSMTNANTISAAHRTAHATAAGALRTAINAVAANGGNVSMVALSYYKDKAIRPNPIPLVFTGVSVDDRIDSQRRRLGRDR